MFSETHRCTVRPARVNQKANSPAAMPLTLLLALMVLMLAPAGSRAAADESPIRFVGSPSRLQPRLTNETGTPAVSLNNTEPLPMSQSQQAGFIFTTVDPAPDLPEPLSASANRSTGEPLLVAQSEPTRELEEIPTPFEPPLDNPISPGGMIEVPCFVAPPMSAVKANIALPVGDLPSDRARFCSADTPYVMDSRLEFGWAQFDFHWSATCLCHKPLYFEEINAERYGYTVSRVLQPIISGGKFFLTIPALPYLMTVDRPCDCIYTLGQYRPGDCVPRRWNRVPLQASAAIVEVGTIAGLILLIP
ncbi:hypothetical protein Pla144_36340 [Bythopirellula polymerisocia]|uniref:Uncharacterized protein n=2 Tax=Bythopirellula polymerisocia TaxID=2528003 RepID=A0A5C6CJW3_9BACT|nr:hypothetical protein Pla144_36340 [Bythopirellula polymerisocia]